MPAYTWITPYCVRPHSEFFTPRALRS